MPLVVKREMEGAALTRRIGEYVQQFLSHLERPDGPDELGVIQLWEELRNQHEVYSGVWAYLQGWHRAMIKHIVDRYVRDSSKG